MAQFLRRGFEFLLFGALGWTGNTIDVRAPESQASLEYELEFHLPARSFPLQSRPTWLLTIKGKNLDPEQGAANLVFHSWGNWRELDSLYLDIRHAEPPLEVPAFPGNSLLLLRPDDWDGSFEVQIAIHPLRTGSAVQSRYGMLPTWSPSYSFGQTRNVFPTLYQDHGPAKVKSKVTLRAPRNCPIATGWRGIGKSPQVIEIDPTDGNGFIAFGEPLDRQDRTISKPAGADKPNLRDRQLQVLQYGQAFQAATAVADLLVVVDRHISSTLEVPPPDPSLVFITDAGGGGMGAEYGLVLGFMRDTPDWQATNPYYYHFVAHEYYHNWLGNMVEGGESFTWFHEGFTDYFSLWHLAAAGLISQEWFATRILELGDEARDKSSWGKIAFAQTDVSWRDGDGPVETMAYKGGAMLAFALDVELRANGKPGLPQLMRDILQRRSHAVTIDTLRQWCHNQGLEEFWQQYVEEAAAFEPRAYLRQVGFDPESSPLASGEDSDAQDLRRLFFDFAAED